MVKKFLLPITLLVGINSCVFAQDDLRAEIEALKKQMAELKDAQSKINIDALKKQISEVKAHDAGDNIKFDIDFRTAYDIVDYKIKNASDQSNNIWSNKLRLGMASSPADNLVFKGALQVNKVFGNNSGATTASYQNFDWYSSQTPDDSSVRLAEAYFLYFGNNDGKIPYTASFGRRPSIDGFMTNLREDNDSPSSPIGHNINMEFDGASFKFDLDKVSGVSGMYFKLCLGRGNSNTSGKYSDNTTSLKYIDNSTDSPNMDLIGIIGQLYDNGQYKVLANYFQAFNVMGYQYIGATPSVRTAAGRFSDVGDMSGGALSLQINGIGDGISDFLDDTTAFVSFAFSKTDPQGTSSTAGGVTAPNQMLGSNNSEVGTSYYMGIQIPDMLSDGRIGFEYNHGSKYWRSFTYGEDTLIGSKLAARGDAYEIYYNKPLVGKNLTMQLRYTYVDYDYTGSDGFFGNASGTPLTMTEAIAQGRNPVESASNIRMYLRYRY
ncbi:MAG: DUF3373 family protein [Sulfurospirillaceae bacterium]|nr:DUF3373 family protein [Sulfurospirillaceae bacterium]